MGKRNQKKPVVEEPEVDKQYLDQLTNGMVSNLKALKIGIDEVENTFKLAGQQAKELERSNDPKGAEQVMAYARTAASDVVTFSQRLRKLAKRVDALVQKQPTDHEHAAKYASRALGLAGETAMVNAHLLDSAQQLTADYLEFLNKQGDPS